MWWVPPPYKVMLVFVLTAFLVPTRIIKVTNHFLLLSTPAVEEIKKRENFAPQDQT